MRSEGKIRHIGVSNVTPEQLAVARTITDIATAQNRLNLTNGNWHNMLAVSPVTLPIPGTATPAHLEDNLAAAALQLEQGEIHAITAAASRATQRAIQAT